MRLTHNLLATLRFCTLVGGAALAQSPERDDAPRRGPGADRTGADGRGAGGATAFMRMIPVMAALDANQDGRISSDEIENASAALKKLDKNKDGQLTIDELRPRGGAGIVGRRGAAGQRGRPGNVNAAFVAETLRKHDANKDGKLSGDEIPDQFARRIERIDLDGDKAIS